VRLYTTRLAALQTQIGAVQGQSTQPGSIVLRPDRPSRASGLSPTLVVLAASLVGLLVGLVLAIWRGSRKRGVVAKAAPELAGVPTLASVATFRKLAIGMPIPSIQSDDDFRLAAIALLVNTPINRAIAVASVTGDNSISAVSFRLARALVVSGFQVVLIDAGETNPTVAEVVGVDDRPGLSEMLSGADTDSIPLPVVQGVEVLPSGELSAGASGPGGSVPRMRAFVDELKATADFVLINTPSLDSPTGLAQLLCVDSSVLVVDERSVKERGLVRATQMIDRMNVDLLGIISARPAKHSDKKGKPHARAKVSSRGAGSATGGATAADRSSPRKSTATSNSDASAKDPVAGRSNASAKLLPWPPIRRSH
jgi:Mrp family chromosome partitioning ATPase